MRDTTGFIFQIMILIMLLIFAYIGIKNHIVIGAIFCIISTIIWIVFILIGVIEEIKDNK